MSLPEQVTQLETEISRILSLLGRLPEAQIGFATVAELLAENDLTVGIPDGTKVRVLEHGGFDLVAVSSGTVHYTAASGAKFRLRMDRATPMMLGAAGDGVSDDKAALDALEASDCVEIDLAGRDFRYVGEFSTEKPIFGGTLLLNSGTADYRFITRDGPVQAMAAGTLFEHGGFAAPIGALVADGSAVSRTEYARLFHAITLGLTADVSSGSAVLVGLSDTSKLGAGMVVEGPGIPAGAEIASVDGAAQITLDVAATATASGADIRIFAWGAGDGSSTFNLPDARGEFRRGWDAGRGVDAGRVLGSAQADAFKAHSHEVLQSQASTEPGVTTRVGSVGTGDVNETQSGDTEETGGTETRPRNIATLVCIKT